MDRFQPRQELEAEQLGEREGHDRLPVAVHILAVHLQLGAVAHDALDHAGHLGRGRRLQLRVDAQRFPLDMPVNHHAAPAISDVPLRGQVLVPGAEVLAVGGAGVGALAPDQGITGSEGAVRHDSDGFAQLVHGDVAASGIEQVLVGGAVLGGVHALQPGVGAKAVQAQQQARAQHRTV